MLGCTVFLGMGWDTPILEYTGMLGEKCPFSELKIQGRLSLFSANFRAGSVKFMSAPLA